MAILDILTYPDPRLKKKAQPVREVNDEIRKLIADMAETMYAAPGVGLAAIQVGIPLRVIVIDVDWKAGEERNLITLINPEIVAREGEIVWEEGCLSVPELFAEVRRSAKVLAKALDGEGKGIEVAGEGLLSVALQHEIDHLDGILFLDRLSRVKREIYKKKLKERLKEEGYAGAVSF